MALLAAPLPPGSSFFEIASTSRSRASNLRLHRLHGTQTVSCVQRFPQTCSGMKLHSWRNTRRVRALTSHQREEGSKGGGSYNGYGSVLDLAYYESSPPDITVRFLIANPENSHLENFHRRYLSVRVYPRDVRNDRKMWVRTSRGVHRAKINNVLRTCTRTVYLGFRGTEVRKKCVKVSKGKHPFPKEKKRSYFGG